MQTEILKVLGMNDEACAEKIARALEAVDGVNKVHVSLAGKRATIQFDERLASSEQLHAALLQAGYDMEAAPPTAGNRSGCCGGCGGG